AESWRCSDKAAFAKSSSAGSPDECGVNPFGWVRDVPFLGNLPAHTVKQRIDSRMVALNRRAGAVHLEPARNHLQGQNGHGTLTIVATGRMLRPRRLTCQMPARKLGPARSSLVDRVHRSTSIPLDCTVSPSARFGALHRTFRICGFCQIG